MFVTCMINSKSRLMGSHSISLACRCTSVLRLYCARPTAYLSQVGLVCLQFAVLSTCCDKWCRLCRESVSSLKDFRPDCLTKF